MRKFIVLYLGVFIVFSAFGANENVPTSKDYVDTAVAVKQDKILANDGTAQALTNTGTAGEYGTKNIYDSTGEYSAQTDALIDAVTMNTAVQNAINTEFQCIEYNPNDPTDCWIMDIRGSTGHSTKNLLDASFMDKSTYTTVSLYGAELPRAKILPTEPNKTYTLSATLTYTGSYYYYIRAIKTDGTVFAPSGGTYMWNCANNATCSGTRNRTFTFTTEQNAAYMLYFANNPSQTNLTLSNFQMEEGSVATEYEPYQNLYIPSGN